MWVDKSLWIYLLAPLLISNAERGCGSVGWESLLFEDDFERTSIGNNWIIERDSADLPGVYVKDGRLYLESHDGITVWYKEKLKGNIRIEYDRRVVMEEGKHDRLSDLNQFWMATDPGNRMFSRKGGFREYDSLQMYYCGFGGNYNSTTRLRRYDGRGKQELVGEYTDSSHLLTANKTYHIEITCREGISVFRVDGELFFDYTDKYPFSEGWFGWRSTRSRQWIDNLRIWSIK